MLDIEDDVFGFTQRFDVKTAIGELPVRNCQDYGIVRTGIGFRDW